MKYCETCHGDRYNRHIGTTVETIINLEVDGGTRGARQRLHGPERHDLTVQEHDR